MLLCSYLKQTQRAPGESGTEVPQLKGILSQGIPGWALGDQESPETECGALYVHMHTFGEKNRISLLNFIFQGIHESPLLLQVS